MVEKGSRARCHVCALSRRVHHRLDEQIGHSPRGIHADRTSSGREYRKKLGTYREYRDRPVAALGDGPLRPDHRSRRRLADLGSGTVLAAGPAGVPVAASGRPRPLRRGDRPGQAVRVQVRRLVRHGDRQLGLRRRLRQAAHGLHPRHPLYLYADLSAVAAMFLSLGIMCHYALRTGSGEYRKN